MSPQVTSGQPHRDLSIDHLRALVVLALILFHSARLFDSEDWHVKNLETFLAADVGIAVFNIIGMPLLFLLAGMSAFASLGTRGAGRFLGERFGRLFVPLGFGILIVVPPQVYIERISSMVALRTSPIDFSGSFLDFYPYFFTSCCYPDGNFSWHHLWFLAYLFVFSVLLLPVLLLLRRWARRHEIRLSRLVASLLLLGLGLPPLAIELGLRSSFPSTYALIDDWASNLHYAWLMLAGALVMAGPDLRRAIGDTRRPWLIAAVVLSAGWLALRFGIVTAPIPGSRLVLRTAAEWSCIVALLGYGARYLARPLPFLTRFGAVAMPFYIVHQTIIILLGFWLVWWVDVSLVKYAVVAAMAFGASLAVAHMAPRHAVLRVIFGLKPAGGHRGSTAVAAVATTP
jgi:glucans biosynthesis protein C